ncbi:MarR family protein [Haloactinopolyspora alba]|uniref:MarR family protein n=1 Tax=Haloactinopolyspora alba TaxID=648780 RepID=A0A2P8E7B1_9ACTN|nr:helix-turn-helix domain-containing protein [Haloactinopolyspora alba]PSL05362.1 MarR family protein [Haloactinopolyspora alba]
MSETAPSRDDELLKFVEQFAFVLVDAGMARMPARVFAYVLADDAEKYTANELAEGLQVSPAAISGAVRALVQGGLLAKEREPGSRADHYRIYDDDVWSHIMMQRLPLLSRYETILEHGIERIGPGQGANRLAETLDYIRFTREEFTQMQKRWQQRRAEKFGDGTTKRSEVGQQTDR